MWLWCVKPGQHQSPLHSSDPWVSPATHGFGQALSLRKGLDVSPWKLNQHKSSENSSSWLSYAEQLGGSSACCGLINNAIFSMFSGEKSIQNSAKGNYILGWTKHFMLFWNTLSSQPGILFGLVAENLSNSKLKIWNFQREAETSNCCMYLRQS